MRSAKALAFLFVCVLFTTLVSAQTGTSSLRGVVSDPKGAVLPGATVTVSDKQNGFTRSTTTDGHGEYQFQQLPPSTYTVAVSGKGFAEVKQEGVQLLVGVPTTLPSPRARKPAGNISAFEPLRQFWRTTFTPE